MEIINQAIEKITALQPNEQDHIWAIGEQLKDFCRGNAHDADLILHDLDIPEMSLAHAEKKLEAYANSHRKGNKACVPPDVAEEILRKFYHLTPSGGQNRETIVISSTPPATPPSKAVSVNLDDFL